MTQTRTMSAVETAANIAIGAVIALISQLWIFRQFDIDVPMTTNLQITIYFTIVSVCRSYVLRRLFNSFKGLK